MLWNAVSKFIRLISFNWIAGRSDRKTNKDGPFNQQPFWGVGPEEWGWWWLEIESVMWDDDWRTGEWLAMQIKLHDVIVITAFHQYTVH